MEALDELTRLKRSGKFDPNSPAHMRLARAAGLSPEEIARMDADDLLRRRQALDRENGDLEEEWNERMKRRREIEKSGSKSSRRAPKSNMLTLGKPAYWPSAAP
ncbi:hypothetical protein WG908_08035 [Sphingobium sp. AN641]|uniref:hypothetical protein n=1 Tax=Sphingobium sp. AN641 TaxID=3133443 RepID=UPI0030BF191B